MDRSNEICRRGKRSAGKKVIRRSALSLLTIAPRNAFGNVILWSLLPALRRSILSSESLPCSNRFLTSSNPKRS